jgi:hypothetical protein
VVHVVLLLFRKATSSRIGASAALEGVGEPFFYCNPYNSLSLIHQRRDIAVYSSPPGKIKLSRRIPQA